MNYLTDQRRNALASEYVLGTLQGPARIRFQRLLMQHSSMRLTLWNWEGHLNTLGGSLPAQQVPPQVWKNICERLGFNEATPVSDEPENIIRFPQKTPRKWQWFTALSTAAAIVFALLLFTPQFLTKPSSNAQVAVVQSEKAQALWLIQLTQKVINVQATTTLAPLNDKDYELWIVAKDGRPPISLGLLPKRGKSVLPRAAIIDKIDIAALAVSLEPLGGSPNGKPTTVLYTAELLTI